MSDLDYKEYTKQYNSELVIEFNEDNMYEYIKYYRKMNPRTRKSPIESPLCVSLNKFTSMVRIAQHDSKVKQSEYCMWLLEQLEIPKLMLEDCEIHYIATFPTKTRRDLDGLILNSKYYNDVFVEYGLLKDDSFYQLRKLTFSAEYEKGVKKIRAIIRY